MALDRKIYNQYYGMNFMNDINIRQFKNKL